MFLFFQNSANYNDGVENNTNNEIPFVMALMTPNHHLNMNLIYLMMEVMCSLNHNTGLCLVVGWLEFVVVGFVDVGE